MTGLTLAVLLLAMGFGAVMVLLSVEHDRDILVGTIQHRTETAAASLDLMLGTVRARLFELANKAPADAAGLNAFYHRASLTIGDHPLSLVLSNPSGHMLLNAGIPAGDHRPIEAGAAAIQQVVKTGLPFISNLAAGPSGKHPVVTVNVPVMRGNKVAYVLSADVLPLIRARLARLHLPAGWLCLVSDRNGLTIARTPSGNRSAGDPVSRPRLLRYVRSADQGWFAATTRDGTPAYVGFNRVRLAGWSVAVVGPANTLLGSVRHAPALLLLAGVGLVALALLAAILVTRRVSRSVGRVARQARALDGGSVPDAARTGLQETDAVAGALHQARQRVARHAAERDKAMAGLHDSEQRCRDLAAELTRANAERLRLLRGTVAAQEAERARVARELHDSLGQYVTALRLGLKAAETRCAPDPSGREQFAALGALTGEVGRELHRLAWELRPAALDDLGLEAVTRQLVADWADRSGLRFDLHIRLNGRQLTRDVETTLYRVLQEAVTNAVKHAEASRVAVVLEAGTREVRLIVEDDGNGMPQPEPGGSATKRLGLVGMRERLALVNGRLEVESTPGGGTTLYARIPL